ncbi:guanylate kinase [Gleimia hominis]|uniref:guanylate kinase n=1 Tax=Gleimia hominis TaxID=595468 RepID=UPI000C80DFFE|nr:guanylate kinase [Gleimia hominis]WIK65088.1 guanylate kinase [Gleimia hominis]
MTEASTQNTTGRKGKRPALTVVAGPTAVGKGTVVKYLVEHYPQVYLSISATTRSPRVGEVDGRSYHFITRDDFDRRIERGDFLEWATVHRKHKYGTLRGPIERALRQGRPALLEIDLEGARQVRTQMPGAQFVFIAPPSWDELVARLRGRGSESEEQMRTRLETARIEMAAKDEFDHVLVNDEVEDTAQALASVMGLT